ncbi:hypothetical protein F6V25_09050 [Oryzomonas japonica]|uniref:Type II secretion system protein PulP n=1 Tax=Oryzomonas japonica TaxID=2603858 RepID=A0A7J4ZRX3_9BACT|nr:hypothetical protein [Oryzomonas japonica]KAB0665846.1 hypothetical protein F6V25_09050 [Oryzomonas japonica]
MNRQRLILSILLVALVAAVIWSFWATPRPKVAPPAKNAPGQRGAPARDASGRTAPAPALPSDSRIVRLDLLGRGQEVFKGYRRDIFRPIFVDELKIMQNKAAALKVVKPPPLPPLPPPPPPSRIVPTLTPAEERAQQNRRELARFIFKGFLSKDQQKTIFLSKDGAILLVKKGDIFERRYRAASISDQALTIQVTDTGEEIVIPLMENLSLKAVP